jgi:hypothetical protein
MELSMAKFRSAQETFKLNGDFKALQTRFDDLAKDKDGLIDLIK